MSGSSPDPISYTMRPATAAERADVDCYNCDSAIEYMVEPQGVGLCRGCACVDIAVHLGARATPRGSGYMPTELTGELREKVASMTIPPACMSFRPFISAKLERVEGRRRRIIVEYEVAEGDPL